MRNLYSCKKGQVGQLAPMIITLTIAAVFLVMGIIMSQEIADVPNDVTVTVINESGGYINSTHPSGAYNLSTWEACAFNSPGITAAYNASGGDGTLIAVGNYTLSTSGLVTNATVTNWNDVNFSYTYNWGDQACIQGNLTVVGLGTFADFWEIIVLAIVITVVIGLLLIVFGGKSVR